MAEPDTTSRAPGTRILRGLICVLVLVLVLGPFLTASHGQAAPAVAAAALDHSADGEPGGDSGGHACHCSCVHATAMLIAIASLSFSGRDLGCAVMRPAWIAAADPTTPRRPPKP
jgi:hypothetical protein